MITPLSKNQQKLLQKLKHKKYRDIEKQFLVSGLRAVTQCLEHPDYCMQLIVDETKQDLIFQLELVSIKYLTQNTLSSRDFNVLVDEKTPQGICLVCRKPDTQFSPVKITGKNYLYLDRINDPGNLGTIMRSASWFAWNGLLLSPESADLFQPKTVRAGAGTIFNIPLYENVTTKDLQKLKASGYSLYATGADSGKELNGINFSAEKIILFGSEAHGLAKELQDVCDKECSIKRFGKGESLNLAIAASIIMCHISNREM
jgi:TrmH family RNA methyltransferase